MDYTCKFFAPAAQDAHEHGLVATDDWPFEKLMAGPCCINPAMGATDMPVPCPYTTGDQPNCAGYARTPQTIHQVWRLQRAHTALGEGQFIVLSLVEERHGLGMRALYIHRIETNDPMAATHIHEGVMEGFLSTRYHEHVEEAANTYLRTELARHSGWERVPALETTTLTRSYFAHVQALAQRATVS